MAAALPSAATQAMSSTTPSDSPTLLQRLISPLATRRARKQASIFFAGAAFLFFSTGLTRRAVRARHLATIPKRFTPSNEPNRNFSNPGEAVEALTLATLNVTSAALMLTGGTLWAFDISSIEDMRRKVRGKLGWDGIARSEGEVEEEFEEWIAGVLSRKERKEEEKRRRGETEEVRGGKR